MLDLVTVNNLMVTVAHPAATSRPRPPILFIHGLFAGAWVFEECQRFFAQRGYPAYAVNLRGHAGSRPVTDIGRVSVADYASDALEVAQALTERSDALPIVIGHSMGGLLAQTLAEARAVTAAILLCPAPPRGIPLVGLALYARLSRYVPAILRSRPIAPTPADADAIILNGVPAHQRSALFARFTPGSGRAGRDMLLGVPVDARRIRCPVLVVSASADRFVPPGVARRVATRYRAPYREYFGNAHFLPGEPRAEAAMREIEHWIDCTLGLGGHDTPGLIRLQELARLRGKTVTLAFRGGQSVRAKVIDVDFEEPSEIVYEVRPDTAAGPRHPSGTPATRLAAAPLESVRDFRVVQE
jgi:pimeloyl-ACP methyl ester carboxylesterase